MRVLYTCCSINLDNIHYVIPPDLEVEKFGRFCLSKIVGVYMVQVHTLPLIVVVYERILLDTTAYIACIF